MELQAALVLCGLGVAGVAVLLLMGLFSAAGTSYEEAVAQQRKAATELLALAATKNKPKKTKKANKKLAREKKGKEGAGENVTSVTVGSGSDAESDAPVESGIDEEGASSVQSRLHVDFSAPVVVDVPRNSLPNIKIRKRKDLKVKPILINKEDPSCISDANDPPSPTSGSVSNHFEESHPKDEFELLHSHHSANKAPEQEPVIEKKEIKPIKIAKGSKTAVKSTPEPPKDDLSSERRNSSEAPKDQRKAKKTEKKPQIEELQDVIREEIVPPLNVPQPSELTTDKLLKQALVTPQITAVSAPPPPQPKAKKSKKTDGNVLSLMAAGDGGGVNVGELVRLISDAVLSRTEIQILTEALLNKQHGPLPQHSEWTEGPNDPIQKLKRQLADKEKALADEQEASQALHAKLKELRSSLNAEKSRATASARAIEEAAGTHRAELHTLQARLQRVMDENHALVQEKMLLQSKLGAENDAQAQRVQLEMHIQRLSESEAALVQQLNALQVEVNARVMEIGQARCEAAAARDTTLLAQQHTADLAQQLQEANRVCSEFDVQRQNAMHAEQHLQQELRQAQERLNAQSELQSEVQRLQARLQQAELKSEKLETDSEKQKSQLLSELTLLHEQLAAREAELAEVRQMHATAAHNGLSLEAQTDEQKVTELAKIESVLENLRSELVVAQKNSQEQREQVANLREQLQQYQDKNNELRTKNWKVMEALQSAEKALQAKSVNTVAAPEFAKEVVSRVSENQASSQKNDTKVSPQQDHEQAELIAQNERLQGAVVKYKKIIDDTEGVLSRLQQNVTAEEQRWIRQLADKQRELDELKQRTVTQMQNKIDTLQAELDRLRTTNHNHSFPDSERLAEERLMLGLPDKHMLDTFNGPLQVDLEEK